MLCFVNDFVLWAINIMDNFSLAIKNRRFTVLSAHVVLIASFFLYGFLLKHKMYY